MAHTPGPWHDTGLPDSYARAIVADGPHGICTLPRFSDNKLERLEQEANARLITASPTMYEYIAKRAALGDNEAKQLLEVLGDATSKEPNWPPGGHVGQAEQKAP